MKSTREAIFQQKTQNQSIRGPLLGYNYLELAWVFCNEDTTPEKGESKNTYKYATCLRKHRYRTTL